MSLKIVFPADRASVTSSSLYQWDYGQILQIESADLLPIVEVHFACIGMTEAIVRPCAVNNGLATVAIPDICLEHAGTIMAWVFEINGTEGMTRKTITIPVISRVKPSPGGDIPTAVYDRYTELVTEINEAVTALTAGNVTVVQAKNANYATEAGHATTANSATTAQHADTADTANTATNANRAVGSDYAGELTIYSEKNYGAGISRTGLFLVTYTTSQGAIVSDLIFIDKLNQAVSSGSSKISYDAATQRVSTSDGTIRSVYRLGIFTSSSLG